MTPPDTTRALALPCLPRDEQGPVFAEPWQAEAFAMVIQLFEAGVFTWAEWTVSLGAALRGATDDGSRYYEHWLTALEALVAGKQVVAADTMQARKQAWIAAYQHTPHGQPVLLAAERT